MHDFELFCMKPSETIGDMYTRFTDVVNGLKALGKSFLNLKLVNKVLRSLSRIWDSKVIAIQETNDLNKFSLEELIGPLMTYEMAYDELDELKNYLPKKRKDFALRTKGDHTSKSSSDGELKLLTIKLKKFLKQESKNKNKLKKEEVTK